MAPATYVDETYSFDAEISKDPYVEAACIFGEAMTGDWHTYEVDELVDELIRPDRRIVITPPPEVQPMPTMAKIGNLEVIDLRGEMPDDFPAVPYQEKNFISIHHSVTPKSTTPQQIYQYHKGKFGGIGYNFLVDDWGAIYYVGECNTSRAAVGQITQGNRRGVHICMIGDFSVEKPSDACLASTKKLIANIQHAYGAFLPPVPHLLFNNNTEFDTACPGGSWRLWWPAILRAVGE